MPSSSVAAQVPAGGVKGKRARSSVSQSLTAKRPRRSCPASNLWFDRLTPDLQVYLARFLSEGDSLGQTTLLLDIADASTVMRDAALTALGHRLVLYYAAPHAARWTRVFHDAAVRTVVYGDDWPGKFEQKVKPRPATLFSAPTLQRAEFNAEDEDVLDAVRGSQSVAEVVVRVHSRKVCLKVLDVLRTLANVQSVEVQCHAKVVAECPFGAIGVGIGDVEVTQDLLQECCKDALVVTTCLEKCHPRYTGSDSSADNNESE